MTDPTYSVRRSLWDTEQTYSLTDDALAASDGRTIRFADVRAIRVYDVPGADMAGGGTLAASVRRCVVWPARGRPIVLVSAHYRGFGKVEDRSASFVPFVAAFLEHVAHKNPGVVFLTGMPAGLWWSWVGVLVLLVAVAILAAGMIIVTVGEGKIVSLDFVSALLFALTMIGGAVSIAGLLIGGRPRASRRPAQTDR